MVNWKTNYWLKDSEEDELANYIFYDLPKGWRKAKESKCKNSGEEIYYINFFRDDGLGLRIEQFGDKSWNLSKGKLDKSMETNYIIRDTEEITESSSKLVIFNEAIYFMLKHKGKK
jgi:hypothetical protein